MKPNQPDANTSLERLAEPANWWRRFFQSDNVEEIHRIISELSPLNLVTLDQRVRSGWTAFRFYDLQNWQNLRPSDVARLARSKFGTSLVGLASFHFDGYVREAAVDELALFQTGEELPFLLIRLNDWVPQVRGAAVIAVISRLNPTYGIHLLKNISLVCRLRECGRSETKFVEDVFELLKRSECKEVLQYGMTSSDRYLRRLSFRLAADAQPSARAGIIEAAMTDLDPFARSWAVRHFLPEATPDELSKVIEPMLKDRFMPVRRDALWHLASKCPDIAKWHLRDALLDPHGSVRETARMFLSLAGVKDAREFYVSSLASENDADLFAAICGLGETGDRSDVTLVLPFVNSPMTKVRRAVVDAIGRLDLQGQFQRLVDFLADEMASVSNEAWKALRPKASSVPLADLETLFVFGNRYHVRRNAITLILHGAKWRKLPLLLQACVDEDDRIAGLANKALRSWFANYNKSFIDPTQDELQKVADALDLHESRLPRGFVTELQACMKIYSD